jgi:signal transduction histidine kinase
VLVAALVLLIIVIVLLINHRKNKLEKTLWEQFSAQLIQAQETERQRISKELHDSVGQNILFIKSQIHKHFADSNPSLSQSVDNALEEVRSISKDLYPNQLDQYGLISAIDDLCEKIKESTTIFVSSDVQLPEVNLSKETQINCFRIVQECVNNSIKHAKATAIRITGELAGGNFVLIVQDNGVGFEIERVQAKVHRSFGLLNLQERIRLLKGKFDLESAPGRGTKSIFTIPI